MRKVVKLTAMPGQTNAPGAAPPEVQPSPIDFDENCISITDLDGDGHINDVLALTDERTLVWLQRLPDGRFKRQTLKLPKKFKRLETSAQNGWNGCFLIGWRTCHWSKLLRWELCVAGTCRECLSSIPPPPGIPPSIHLPLPLWGVPVPLQLALFLPPFDPITGMVDVPVGYSVIVKDGHLNLDEGKEFPLGFFRTYADLDGDSKPDSIFRVRRDTAREEGSILVRLSTTNRQHPLPHSSAFFEELVIHDINGDGRMELVGLEVPIHSVIPHVICWRYDPRALKWETLISPPIQSDWIPEPFIAKQNKRLFVFAIKQARIWRWELMAKGWRGKSLGELPELDDFTWHWTGKRLVLLIKSKVPMLRELLGIYQPRPSRLFSVDENGQWKLLAYVSPKVQFSPMFTELDTDLDGDGEKEIIWQDCNLVFVGRFHEGKWQLGQITLPMDASIRCSLRVGSNRWLIFTSHGVIKVGLGEFGEPELPESLGESQKHCFAITLGQ